MGGRSCSVRVVQGTRKCRHLVEMVAHSTHSKLCPGENVASFANKLLTTVSCVSMPSAYIEAPQVKSGGANGFTNIYSKAAMRCCAGVGS